MEAFMSTTESTIPVGEGTQIVSADPGPQAAAFPFVVTTAGVGVGTTQPISPLTVYGGGSPPLVVQGSGSNYAMLGLRADRATESWQLQATIAGETFCIAYPQNSPRLVIDQQGNVGVAGSLTTNGLNVSGPLSVAASNFTLTGLTTPPAGVPTVDVVADPTTGKLYRQN
jgi:hypothetical protein